MYKTVIGWIWILGGIAFLTGALFFYQADMKEACNMYLIFSGCYVGAGILNFYFS